MLDRPSLWSALEPLVREQGFELYEIELPVSRRGALRVFISTAQAGPAGEPALGAGTAVTVEDCARVSKRISALLEDQASYLADVTLEVSSPGINRKLTRPEHFKSALGERVRLKAVSPANAASQSGVVLGKLMALKGETVELEEESSKNIITLALKDIREARVDFLF